MKSLFFRIVFAFCFVIVLAGTKAVPTGETPSSGKSQNKACHGRPLPSADRPQKPIYAIDWRFFVILAWKQIRYFPSCSYRIRFALPKERKDYVGFRIYWRTPCRFKSCPGHHDWNTPSIPRKGTGVFSLSPIWWSMDPKSKPYRTGMMTVLERYPCRKWNGKSKGRMFVYYLCKCDCGKEFIVGGG